MSAELPGAERFTFNPKITEQAYELCLTHANRTARPSQEDELAILSSIRTEIVEAANSLGIDKEMLWGDAPFPEFMGTDYPRKEWLNLDLLITHYFHVAALQGVMNTPPPDNHVSIDMWQRKQTRMLAAAYSSSINVTNELPNSYEKPARVDNSLAQLALSGATS